MISNILVALPVTTSNDVPSQFISVRNPLKPRLIDKLR